ncbi:MAG: YicC family protein [Gammaproteobacteria bacterium]|nr:YicC family protein [Gammaproteobacteria bacterium]
MTKSMTAFARSESGHISWEIRSVNHRYLEVGVKVPDAFRSLEIGLRNKLKARLNRGKIDCQLRIGHSQASEASLSIDEKLLEDLTGALATIIPKLETVAPVNPLEVLKWPGLLSEPTEDEEAIKRTVVELFDAALAQLIEMRSSEGAELRKIILEKLADLRSIVGQAATEAPIISARQRDKMISKLNDLKIEADPGRIEQELVIMAQKSDVAEELDRLNTHIEEVSATLGSKEAVGRRLDFLMQELNREANTLSSKAVATNTTIQAVELKVAIEQMREQIQNIE